MAKSGLPGEHHFFIAFNTRADGVTISKRLLEKYPQEMTIVLQHRFWDLLVQEDRFEVKLSFDAIPERLVVPYTAIKVFFDPSVPYGLQFEESEGDKPAFEGDTRGSRTPPRATDKKRSPKRGKTDKTEDGDAGEQVPAIATPAIPAAAARRGGRASTDVIEAKAPANPITKPVAVPDNTDAKIISLDQFRKK